MRVVAGVAFATFVLAGSAQAGDERSCAAQYSLEDHLLLEWAALGGDPHAQAAIAQCSFPIGADPEKMTPAERAYAVRWTTIALCEAQTSDAHDRRDARLRALKEEANISFRRFGGMQKNEKLNWREKDFIAYRTAQNEMLAGRHGRLMAAVSSADSTKAQDDLAEQYSRMGPTGLLKLAELTSCEAFGASKEFEAAAWSAAAEAWRGSEVAGVYAAAEDDDYEIEKIAAEKSEALTGASLRVAKIEKEQLMRTDPSRLAALESRVSRIEDVAAIERLANLSLPATSNGIGIAEAAYSNEPVLTLALQFALESLGHVNFVNGPDNDYGPTTRDAVARMHASAGGEPVTTLTNSEARGAICQAAMKGDPVSLYHLSLMYKNGWGFAKDADKASAAISRAETSMISMLGGGELPAWKADAYKSYAGKIRTLAEELKTPGVDNSVKFCD